MLRAKNGAGRLVDALVWELWDNTIAMALPWNDWTESAHLRNVYEVGAGW